MPPKTPKTTEAPKAPENQAAETQLTAPQPEQAQLTPSTPTLEDAALALVAEAPPATIPPPELTEYIIGYDTSRGGDQTAVYDVPAPPQVAGAIRVRALRAIEHDGVRYGPGEPAGDELEVSTAQAALLSNIQAAERL